MRWLESTVLGLVVIVLGSALAALPDAGYGGLHAELFPPLDPLCIEANRQESVHGAFGGLVAPGHLTRGRLRLVHCDATPENLVDLDIGFRCAVTDIGAPAAVPLDNELFVTRLAYGEDDLLASASHEDGDRNLLREIDADPAKGNGDGRLSLKELSVGINDLPPPGPDSDPTRFGMVVTFNPAAGNDLQGDTAQLELVFRLTDSHAGDLN